jgi:polar amino acid transport system substrate-binding protein
MNLLKTFMVVSALALAAVIPASAQQPTGVVIGQTQVLKVGYPPFATPLSSLPGATPANYQSFDADGTKAQGALIDLTNAVGKDIGVQIQFIAVIGPELPAALLNNKIDVTVANANPNLMAVTSPIYSNSDVLMVKKSDPKDYRTWEDLKGMVVGVLANVPLAAELQKSAATFKEIKLYNTAPAYYQALSAGEVQAVVVPNGIAAREYMRQAQPPSNELRIVESYQPRVTRNEVFGVRKDQTDLLARINGSLAKLKGNGTMRTIFSKYGLDANLVK